MQSHRAFFVLTTVVLIFFHYSIAGATPQKFRHAELKKHRVNSYPDALEIAMEGLARALICIRDDAKGRVPGIEKRINLILSELTKLPSKGEPDWFGISVDSMNLYSDLDPVAGYLASEDPLRLSLDVLDSATKDYRTEMINYLKSTISHRDWRALIF